ncbi:MAG: transketolase C-terminal domain-containing protein [Thermoleophilia bacterium]|nr:transketolase C-terminal domain-containing protein [Thermoleophilia bacterium]
MADELKPRATREAYGEALLELGKRHGNVVALDADLSGSTMSKVFAAEFPERFFNVGVAEANMMNMAAGFAISGKIAYASTFAVFATGRAFDQVRQSIAQPNLPVRIVASHGGLTVGEDGCTHQSVEDIGLMRLLPNMKVIVPADFNQTYAAVLESYDTPGPMYIRTGRPLTPFLYQEPPASLGKGADVLREGSDISIFACGIMVVKALEAAEQLKKRDISAEVVNVSILKPIDVDTVTASLEKTGYAVTAEEHSIIGGLGDAVAEVAAEYCPVRMGRVGIKDVFGKSGKPDQLLEEFNLTAAHMVELAGKVLASGK